jgi:hypothetical protein
MAGRRGANLRRGDRAEQHGIDLLRDVAAVAYVPRTEDTGQDAVATLLRKEGRSLFAEDSFFVQLKAKSVTSVTLKDEEIDWAFNLRLPHMMGTVDLAEDRISLYAFDHCAIHAVPYRRFKLHPKLVLCFRGEPAGLKERADGGLDVWLGPPVVSWTGDDSRKERLGPVREALSAWVRFAQGGVTSRHLGCFIRATWSPNVPFTEQGPVIFAEAHQTSFAAENATRLVPALRPLSAQVAATGSTTEKLAIEAIRAFMRRSGARDPWGLL